MLILNRKSEVHKRYLKVFDLSCVYVLQMYPIQIKSVKILSCFLPVLDVPTFRKYGQFYVVCV